MKAPPARRAPESEDSETESDPARLPHAVAELRGLWPEFSGAEASARRALHARCDELLDEISGLNRDPFPRREIRMRISEARWHLHALAKGDPSAQVDSAAHATWVEECLTALETLTTQPLRAQRTS